MPSWWRGRRHWICPWGRMAGVFLVVCSGWGAEEERQQLDQQYRSSLLFGRVLEMVRESYVDPSKVDYESLTFSALEGMLSTLDPYSEFLDAEEYMEIRRDTRGTFGGVGIYVGIQKDRSLIVNMPVPSGPAFEAGILPGDWILSIEGQPTKGLGLSEAVRLMRGRPGTPVTLECYRPQTGHRFEQVIVRRVINVPTVRDARIISEFNEGYARIGYLRILQFGEHTLEELEEALASLTRLGATGYILDLRNNPGGLLESAVEVTGRFVEPGRVVAYTEGRADGEGRTYYRADGPQHDNETPLVVLINRHSASGAEILAGALKDLGRAVLIGETTYGKGSVQTIQGIDPLGSGPALGVRLTTARYFTPSRNMIHEVGITPHIPVPVTLDEEQIILRKQNRFILPPEKQGELAGLPDRQLDRAVQALKGMMAFRSRMELQWYRRK